MSGHRASRASLYPLLRAFRAGRQDTKLADLAGICRLIERHSTDVHTTTAVPRLSLTCADTLSGPVAVRREPVVHLVASGAQWLSIRGEVTRQQPGSLIVTSLELPLGTGYADAPYRAMVLGLDPDRIADLTAEMPSVDRPLFREPGPVVTEADPGVLDAMHRLLRVLDEPVAIRILAPMIEREVLYRLLSGPAAAVVRRVGRGDDRLRKVRLVADWLRRHPFTSTTVAELAAMASVSASTLHRHFRAVTGRTPLQFQKDQRLREARQRLVAGREAPKAVASAVGYLSLSQFSREYRRHFGTTPRRDLEAGRGAVELA